MNFKFFDHNFHDTNINFIDVEFDIFIVVIYEQAKHQNIMNITIDKNEIENLK